MSGSNKHSHFHKKHKNYYGYGDDTKNRLNNNNFGSSLAKSNLGNLNNNTNSNTQSGFRHNMPHIDIKVVQEPKFICSICKKPINLIAESLKSADSEGYVHFDCALSKIKADYNVQPPMKVSYIGKGKFGIVEFKGGASNQFTIKETIEWESTEKFKAMQDDVESMKK